MAIYRYTTKPQLERGLEIILKPCGSSHTVNNMDLSKNKTEEKENRSCTKSIGVKAKIKAGIRKIGLNWNFCCAWSSSAARNEPLEAKATTT